jgi:hypothetical protein
VKQLSVGKILSPTSLKVSDYFSGKFSDNLSKHFIEYLMHKLTKKPEKKIYQFRKHFFGWLETPFAI